MDLWLWVSHIAVAVVSVVTTRWVTLRNVRVIDHDGHIAFELRHDDPKDQTT